MKGPTRKLQDACKDRKQLNEVHFLELIEKVIETYLDSVTIYNLWNSTNPKLWRLRNVTQLGLPKHLKLETKKFKADHAESKSFRVLTKKLLRLEILKRDDMKIKNKDLMFESEPSVAVEWRIFAFSLLMKIKSTWMMKAETVLLDAIEKRASECNLVNGPLRCIAILDGGGQSTRLAT